VKVGDVVRFEGTSKDVLHSFSVPAFRLKQDVIPGRWNSGWFKAEKPGTYDIQCTEICGIGHGVMFGRIVVHPEQKGAEGPVAYSEWLAANTPR
jgi:cytochrome c oxidase subunit 2